MRKQRKGVNTTFLYLAHRHTSHLQGVIKESVECSWKWQLMYIIFMTSTTSGVCTKQKKYIELIFCKGMNNFICTIVPYFEWTLNSFSTNLKFGKQAVNGI